MSSSGAGTPDSESQADLTTAIAAQLGAFVRSQSVAFACGGSLTLQNSDKKTEKQTFIPFALRWDSADGFGKVVFPVSNATSEANLEKLAQACRPASFGYQGKDVLDNSYRKATKLDRSEFSVDFCPYEMGIIDIIAQMLRPSCKKDGLDSLGVAAELYKLNIYTSPSGFFKPHVDTPRRKEQFGSLVVSFPCRHEGGQLVVRHAGHEMTFDWSSSKTDENTILWAAFYSDCEHEVKEVTDGRRVTLTYNLYALGGPQSLATYCPGLDVKTIPLYQKVEDVLHNEQFLPQGGLLGVFCSHAYAHTSRGAGRKMLPHSLKGADMAVYTVFRAHGLSVSVRAVLDDVAVLERMREDQKFYGEDEATNPRYRPYNRIRNLRGVALTDDGGCDESIDQVVDSWTPNVCDVHWLSVPSRDASEVGFVHLAYGNQAEVDFMYTHAAMLIDVPPAHLRLQESKK